MALAAIGLYGLSVTRSLSERGGGHPDGARCRYRNRRQIGLLAPSGLKLVVAGSAIGLVIAVAVTRLLSSEPWGIDRDVALKVPEAFTSDPDHVARFEREAKVLASMNHPNIVHPCPCINPAEV